MTQTHVIECITLQAPSDWAFEKQNGESEVSASIRSPGTSFIAISLYREQPDPAALIETAIEAFREEYKELDVYPVEAELCDRETEACDLDFVCLDLVSSVFLRSFATERFTVFLLCQTDALEFDATRKMFDTLSEGLLCDDEGLLPGFGIPLP